MLRKESTTLLLSLEPTENFLEGREERGLESPEGMEVFLEVSEEVGLQSPKEGMDTVGMEVFLG